MRIASHIHNFWMKDVPAERVAFFRILVGLYATIYLTIRTPHLLSYAKMPAAYFRPVGIISILHDMPVSPAILYLAIILLLPLAVLFLLGNAYRLVAPAFFLLLLWTLSYSNSFGKILHTDNLLVMHVACLALAPAASAFVFRRKFKENITVSGWSLKLAAVVCATVYLIAGVAKLRYSGFAFFEGETLRNYIAFGNMRKIALGSTHTSFALLVLNAEWLCALLAGFSLVLELTGPFALFSKRIAKWWALSVWGFHLGVLALMAIAFIYPISGIAFAPFFALETIASRPKIRAFLSRTNMLG